MTDNTFMPQAAPEGGTSRTTLLVAGGLVAAVVLGGGGFVLLSGGGDDLESTGAPVITRTTTKPPATKTTTPVRKPATKATAAKPGVLPAKTTVRIGRDPFKALYVQPVAAAAPATGTNTTTATGTSSGTSGGTTGGTTVGQAYALTLKKIATSGDTKLYTFNVAGETKTVIAAQRFGKYGELIVLGWVKGSTGKPVGALIQVGDDEPIVAKLGTPLSVQ